MDNGGEKRKLGGPEDCTKVLCTCSYYILFLVSKDSDGHGLSNIKNGFLFLDNVWMGQWDGGDGGGRMRMIRKRQSITSLLLSIKYYE